MVTVPPDTFATDNLPPVEWWPTFLLDRPEFQYPKRLNCVPDFLDRWVEAGRGDTIAIIAPDGDLTYRQLFERVNRIANVLVGKLGLVKGTRVLLRSANNPMMVATYLAVIKAGGIVIASMPLMRARELVFPANKARTAIVLCDWDLCEELEKARPRFTHVEHVIYWGAGTPDSLEGLMAEASPEFCPAETAAEDVCLIAFTSGTTGEPKGTMHFHRDMLAVCDGYAANVLRAGKEDRFIGSAPLAFTFGLGASVLFPFRIGAATILLEKAGPPDLAAAIARYRATVSFTAPTAYRAMLGQLTHHDLSSLRKCVSAGEALPLGTFEAWLSATGIKLMDGIGATEMLHIFISAREDQIRPGATGIPVPGYEAKLIDDEGGDLPRGSTGRLAVRGPTGCRYLADERQRSYVQDGWNLTGDTYHQDADGYFWYQARSDDMIISSGYNIAGPEVEAALLTHEAVAECGVVGAPDADRGNIVKAYVVLRDGFVPDDDLVRRLQEHVKAEISPYKYPRAIAFVQDLPKTQTGKLQRFALREMARSGG
jgi:2-aminobenzoate-CoA ligase